MILFCVLISTAQGCFVTQVGRNEDEPKYGSYDAFKDVITSSDENNDKSSSNTKNEDSNNDNSDNDNDNDDNTN